MATIPKYTVRDRPADLDLTVFQGDTYEHEVLVTSEGQAIDITGYSWAGVVKKPDGNNLLSMVQPTHLTFKGLNTLVIKIADDVTAPMPPGLYSWELWFVDAVNDIKKTVYAGCFRVLDSKAV